MSSRQKVKLGDLCAFRGGSAFPKEKQGASSGDVPFIKVSDMNLYGNEWKIVSSTNWVSQDTLSELKAKIQPKDATVFAKIGEALKADRMRMLTRGTLIDNNMMAAVPVDGTNPLFLYYLLKNIKLSHWAEGSALPYFKQGALLQIEVEIPGNPNEQECIAEILSCIDEKIQLDNCINGYLAA